MRAAALLLLLFLPTASAHAVLQAAEPSPNGHAEEGVAILELRFTEAVEREHTSADVLDVNGESWAAGPIAFDDARDVVRLPVKPLPDGLYSASWKALSADAHTTRGSYVFAVGNATVEAGEYPPIVDLPEPGAVAREASAGFAYFAGLFLAAGMPLFALVVLRTDPPRALFQAAAAFGALGVAGALVGLYLLGERTGLGLAIAASAPGRSFALRAAALALAALACAAAALRPSSWRSGAAVALVAGVGAIAATLSPQAASREGAALLVPAAALHLAMGAVWVGGIVAFLLAIPGRSATEIARLAMRFFPWTIASVLALLATGILAGVARLPCAAGGPAACMDVLRTEPYARLVALKLLFMFPLVAIVAYGRRLASPRLARSASTPRAFGRVLALEAVLVGALLVAAGVLGASPPPEPRDAQESVPPAPFEVRDVTAQSRVTLQVTPNPVRVGAQELVVTVHPLAGALPNATQVALKVWHESEGEPDAALDPTRTAPGEWTIEGSLLTRAGTWNVLVILQRPDERAELAFQVPVVDHATTSP